MIIEFDCSICKEHFRVNGHYNSHDIQREHLREKHFKEYTELLKFQDELKKQHKELQKTLDTINYFGEENYMNSYILF